MKRGDYMGIGEMIKKRREELGWTQQELADKMGYTSKSTITRIEKGYNDVSQTNITKFAEVLSVSISYLMEWEKHCQNENNLPSLPPLTIEFQEKFSNLNSVNRENVLHYIDFLASQEHPSDDSQTEKKT